MAAEAAVDVHGDAFGEGVDVDGVGAAARVEHDRLDLAGSKVDGKCFVRNSDPAEGGRVDRDDVGQGVEVIAVDRQGAGVQGESAGWSAQGPAAHTARSDLVRDPTEVRERVGVQGRELIPAA